MSTVEGRVAGALAHPCDVRDPVQIERLVPATVELFGRLDILVANAGVGAYGTSSSSHRSTSRR